MDIGEAFGIFGLSSDSPPEAIEPRFRELAKQLHPDAAGGDGGAMQRLLEAREIVVDAASRRAIVPSASVQPLTVDPSWQLSRHARADLAINRLVRTHGGRLRGFRRTALLFSGLAGFIAATSARFDVLGNTFGFGFSQPLTVFLSLVTAALVLIAGALTLASDAVEQSIEDAANEMDDRQSFLELWAEIELPVTEPITRDEVAWKISYWAGVQWWPNYRRRRSSFFRRRWRPLPVRQFFGRSVALRDLVRVIGMDDFMKLLQAKGTELDLLTVKLEVKDGRFVSQYRLNPL